MLPALALLIAQGPALPPPASDTLGINLEGYAYPYPVQYLTIGGEVPVRLAYMDVQPTVVPNGKVVFLLHGKNFFGAYWKGAIARLSAEGYRVVVPDRIGFGKSSKPLIDYTFDLFAQSDAVLATHLGIAKFAVVGHSMGGMEAVRLATRYPDRITRLVLEDPLGLEDYAVNVPYKTVAERTKMEMDQDDDAYRQYVSGYYVRKDPALIEPFVAIRAAIRRSPDYPRWAEVAARTTQTILYGSTLPELRTLQLPTLFIVGEQDRTSVGKTEVPESLRTVVGNLPELAWAAAKAMPRAQLLPLRGLGHIPHLEDPETFYKALLPFLAE